MVETGGAVWGDFGHQAPFFNHTIRFVQNARIPFYEEASAPYGEFNCLKLKDAGHVLTDEQQIQAVIRSLPHMWDQMKMHLTQNEMIKTLPDICKHLELEEERLAAEKPRAEVHLAESSSKGREGESARKGRGL